MSGERLSNPLGDFPSYTYRISLYILGSEAYGSYVRGDASAIKQGKIIAQSGGVNSGTEERASGIPNDLFIDNLVIKTITTTKETFIPSNSYDFSFQIFEPYGFSFPTQLVKTAMEFQRGNANAKDSISALSQHYLLEIKFYGFDLEGNPISGPEGIYSRAFPILIRKFNFKLDNKVVAYNINAVLINEQIGVGTKRGTVPPNLSLKADTVINAIRGEEQESGQPSKIRGLFQALNEEQEKLKKIGQLETPDKYEVEFVDSALGDSEIVGKWYLKSKAPLTATKNTAGSNPKTAATQNSKKVDKEIRDISIAAGSSIISAIDQILAQSKYVEDSVSEKPREEVQTTQKTSVKVDKEEGKELKWYNITPHVTPGKWDATRNDYQYTIKYVIQPYVIPYARGLYLKKLPTYPGPHKRYKYWYTGENSEILGYEQEYNLLYFQAADMAKEVKTTKESPNNNAPIVSQPGQGADPTQKLSGALEIINNVRTFLYSPGDQIKARLKILGDPDYLMTSTGGAISTITKERYGEDFSINPNSGQVFIEIDFKEGVDYNNDNGLLDINDSITFWDYPASIKGKIQGMAYMVTQVTSTFNKGLFTQDLKLILPPFKEGEAGSGGGDGDSAGADAARESPSAESPTVNNVEGPAIPESRSPDSSAGPAFDSGNNAGFSSSPTDLGTAVPDEVPQPSKKSTPISTPPVVKRTVPTAEGKQVQDDDGSYDRNELARLKARQDAVKAPVQESRPPPRAPSTVYEKVPRKPALREPSGAVAEPTSFRVFDPSTYKVTKKSN